MGSLWRVGGGGGGGPARCMGPAEGASPSMGQVKATCRCLGCWRTTKASAVVPDPVIPVALDTAAAKSGGGAASSSSSVGQPGSGSGSGSSLSTLSGHSSADQMRLGDSTLSYPNGSTYTGQVADGKKHGLGSLRLTDGTRYDADWRNDKRHGEGSELCPDGTRFTGNYVNGMRSGHGVMTWPEGSKYSGQFEHDKANGEGTLFRTDGSVYKGHFSEDSMSGEGCMRWTDGGEYVGQFVVNRRDGKGKMSWVTGRWKSYDGCWKDSLQHGSGTLVDRNDRTFHGIFQGGRLVRWLDEASARDGEGPVDLQVPPYWTNQNTALGFSDRTACSEEQQELIQTMLDGTFRKIRTRDRSGKTPSRLRLVKCHRVENSSMWARYAEAKSRVLARRPDGVQPVNSLDGNPETGFVKTHTFLDPVLQEQLDPRLNEHFLWHGTTPEGAIGISTHGFRIALAGSRAGTYFGRGCYFAECSSKSDEYAREGDHLLAGVFALLLCRVTCGSLFRTTEPDSKAIEVALAGGEFDSVLGDREASAGTFREFVVYDEELVYPEFVVLYERKFDPSPAPVGAGAS